MARELNQDFFKPSNEFKLSLEDWNELKKEVLELSLQMKNAQGGTVFIYSKLVRLFNTIKDKLDKVAEQQNQFKERIDQELKEIQSEMDTHKEGQEHTMTNKMKNLLDQHHQLNKKYNYQLQDLCRSLTQQSEQVWSLTDQLQEIKEELSSPRPSS